MPGPGDRGGKKERPKDTRGALRRILSYLMEYRWLVLLFLLVQLIPFGAIGYMAYQDLTHNQQIAKDYSDDFDIDNI